MFLKYSFCISLVLFHLQLQELLAAKEDGTPKIMGGDKAELHEFPYHVSLTWPPGQEYFCGGVLITPKYVLTAAHCVITDYGWHMQPEHIIIIAGRNFLNETGELRYIEAITPHEDYVIETKQNDVAIIELKEAFVLSKKINIIPLINYRVHPLTKCTVVGFGAPSASGPPTTNHLMKVEVPVQSMLRCRLLFAKRVQIFNGMMCAGYVTGKHDACSGDSGGPFVCDHQLGGIVSAGIGCGIFYNPGIYSDVVYFRPWIDGVLATTNTTLPHNNRVAPSATASSTLDIQSDKSIPNQNKLNADSFDMDNGIFTTTSIIYSEEESIEVPNQYIDGYIEIPDKKSINTIIHLSEEKLPLLPIEDILSTPVDYVTEIPETTGDIAFVKHRSFLSENSQEMSTISNVLSITQDFVSLNMDEKSIKDDKINNESNKYEKNLGTYNSPEILTVSLNMDRIDTCKDESTTKNFKVEEDIVTPNTQRIVISSNIDGSFIIEDQINNENTDAVDNLVTPNFQETLISVSSNIHWSETNEDQTNFENNEAEDHLVTSNTLETLTPISSNLDTTTSTDNHNITENSKAEDNLVTANHVEILMPVSSNTDIPIGEDQPINENTQAEDEITSNSQQSILFPTLMDNDYSNQSSIIINNDNIITEANVLTTKPQVSTISIENKITSLVTNQIESNEIVKPYQFSNENHDIYVDPKLKETAKNGSQNLKISFVYGLFMSLYILSFINVS